MLLSRYESVSLARIRTIHYSAMHLKLHGDEMIDIRGTPKSDLHSINYFLS